MRCTILSSSNNWKDILDTCRSTIGKEFISKEPSNEWKKKILLAEHSPIRLIKIKWIWEDIPYWVSMHFCRHKIGIEHFVKTSRSDRTGTDRTKLYQDNPVNHICEANAQSIINISRKRFCKQASEETRLTWGLFINKLKEIEPELASCCVPDCIYRGFCSEMNECGFSYSEEYKNILLNYRKK